MCYFVKLLLKSIQITKKLHKKYNLIALPMHYLKVIPFQ